MFIYNAAKTWISRRRTMSALRGLSNEALDDIGLTRYDVRRSRIVR